MANLKLNSVTLATESGGTVSVDSAVAGIPAAGVTGALPVGVTGGSGLDAVPGSGITGTLPNAVTDNITTLGTVTAGTLGTGITHSAGSILQMFNVHSIVQSSISGSSSAIILTKTFNRRRGNSHFICQTNICCAPGQNSTNLDTVDPSLALVVNSAVHDTFPNLIRDGYYYSTVPDWRSGTSVSHSGFYDSYRIYCSEDITHISSGSDNDSVTIAVQATSHESGGMYINRGHNTATEAGSPSSLTIYEIA